MKEKQILVCIKEPGKAPFIEPLFENSLKAFQEAVGGYLETVTLASDLTFICTEEGRLVGLPYNTTICGCPFFGTVLAVGVKGDDFASVKGALVSQVLRLLQGDGKEV